MNSPANANDWPALDRALSDLAASGSVAVREDGEWLAELATQLDSRHFYSQVPARAAGDRGVLDLLGVTRQGRLVVIELKASEDLQLPMQAVDYWLRVRRHQREGEFQRDGYFPPRH